VFILHAPHHYLQESSRSIAFALLLAQDCPAGGQCPAARTVDSSNFAITDCNLSKETATVSFTSTLENGKCESVPLSWITLAAFPHGKIYTDICVKSEEDSATITGGVTTLTNVPCGSTLAVYAHDGSFKGSTLGSLGGTLPKRCRDNSGKFYCGPYGQLKLKCDATSGCELKSLAAASTSGSLVGGRRLSSYKTYN
jgi:hypothetical protein